MAYLCTHGRTQFISLPLFLCLCHGIDHTICVNSRKRALSFSVSFRFVSALQLLLFVFATSDARCVRFHSDVVHSLDPFGMFVIE